MPRESHLQYLVWHKTKKILRGPRMTINQPRWLKEAFDELTERDGDPNWFGGTLDQILRLPDTDRFDVARAMGVRKD